jgi:bifunctional UDP-N-acetylglucosamine pyrophosphorylase/glucosamine-1-phosphate N-acetyltransferase
MSLDINYYFGHPERFPIRGFLDGLSYTPEILTKARTELSKFLALPGAAGNFGEMKSDDVHLYGEYRIGAGTVVYNGVTIIGPVYIGENCEIMPGAVIRPYSIIGDGCAVGHGSELKRAVLYGGAKIASLAFVGDSVLGASARIGSGTITANRKFDQTNVTLKLGGVPRDLGDSYFGLVLGDSSRLGANCVTQPGSHIGPYTWVLPSTGARGFIPREKRVYTKTELILEDGGMVELQP